ncbi:MAG TPA: MCP four helix bundle domain-containing protein [Opitutaceae bacterium]|nr:MCP four helix bundle domain-containing protein [Opitutaceae bacterium]
MSADVAAGVKRLKFLIGILAVSNLVLGVLSFNFLVALDRDYNELIDRSLPTINHLRGMTSESSAVHRSLTIALGAQQPDRRAGYLKLAEQALVKEGKDVRDVEPVLDAELGTETVARLKNAHELYAARSSALIALLREGKRQEAGDRVHEMREALDTFMTTVADIADTFAQRSQDEGDLVSANVRKHGTIVLGLGGWPLVVAATLAGLIVVVLGLMINLARQLNAPGDRVPDRLNEG